jgi:hypothetical protein
MANLRSKIPEEAAPELMAEVRAIRDAPNLKPHEPRCTG